jgi:gamma-glutamylcyclotransferase (GGCT)/AIG2-like uncharacterized protein YtfP
MHVFTYGSLMYPAVWERVVSGEYRGEGGALRGYARRRIDGEIYPALVRAAPGDVVEGVLYPDVSAADLAALDHFEGEGEAYRRIEVRVARADGEVVPAWTYLYLDSGRVEDTPWDPARFEAEDLARFLDGYCRERAPP